MELTRTSVSIYRVGSLVFGSLLWLQIGVSALSRELSYTEIAWWRVAVDLAPLVLLLAGLALRNPVLSLLLFPIGVAATLGVGPDNLNNLGTEPGTILLSAVTLIAYVVVTSAWLRSPASPSYLLFSSDPVRLKTDRWAPYRGTYGLRALVLVLTFLVTAAAVPLFEPIASGVVQSYGEAGVESSAGRGLVLCSLVLFFVWCVFAFALFISPTMEQERWVQAQHKAVEVSSRRIGVLRWILRPVFLLLVAGGALVALIVLRSR